MEENRWEQARDMVLSSHGRSDSIGSLGEKTVHAVLKRYLEPNVTYHEAAVAGFVADICNEHGITEIQSASLYKLSKKLEAFLPECPVTVVYPAAGTKHLIWVDPETGELSEPRKSPKKNGFYEALQELLGIREWLLHPNLTVRIMVLELEEYKLLNGYGQARKIRAGKYDRIPLRIEQEIILKERKDYLQLLPQKLPVPFTTEDWQKATKLMGRKASRALRVLLDLELVELCGKEGRRNLYRPVFHNDRNGG